MSESRKSNGRRRILTGAHDVREAVVEIAGAARRQLAIFSHDLEPGIYDHEDFIEAATRLVLATRFARVRVLVADPSRAVKDGHQFVALGRRLSSYIEFRNVRPQYRDHPEAFCVADDRGVVYRALASSWNGIAADNEPHAAGKYLDIFNQIWHACEVEREFRRLHV
ncbi:MAG: hypothetical protein H0W33_01800 [Gammaproteobacteria bacterium]|nr:hypothetical protein [Gammaproteobacteria bacterium]